MSSSNFMKQYIQNHLAVTLNLGLLAAAIVIGAWVADHNQQSYESSLRTELDSKRAHMVELALITDRNGADDTTAAIITDCSRRNDYESLLIRLGELSKQDLITVQNMFESCGHFYEERKALMVSALEREIAHYRSLLTLLGILSPHDTYAFEEEKWNELLSLEKTRSMLLSDQSDIQAKIISELITGSPVHSERVIALVREAEGINELLTAHDHQIDSLRETLGD